MPNNNQNNNFNNNQNRVEENKQRSQTMAKAAKIYLPNNSFKTVQVSPSTKIFDVIHMMVKN